MYSERTAKKWMRFITKNVASLTPSIAQEKGSTNVRGPFKIEHEWVCSDYDDFNETEETAAIDQSLHSLVTESPGLTAIVESPRLLNEIEAYPTTYVCPRN